MKDNNKKRIDKTSCRKLAENFANWLRPYSMELVLKEIRKEYKMIKIELTKTCKYCGGCGTHPERRELKCPACDGKGEIVTVDKVIDFKIIK